MTLQFAIHEVDGDIMVMKNSLSSAPRYDPMRPVLTHTLAMAQTVRHEISGQEEYLNETILHSTEVIFLPFTEQSPNIVQVLFCLSRALLCRSEKSMQLEDAELSIGYLRYLHGLPLYVLDVPRCRIPTLLVQALAVQVKSNADNAMDGLEMIPLCRGLLASGVSAGYPTTAITCLTGALLTVFNRWEEVPPLDQTIECLREALEKCPPGPYLDQVSLALAMALHHRFVIAFSSSGYEEATVLLSKVITSNPSDADSHVLASWMLGLFAFGRSIGHPKPEYTEEAIRHGRTWFRCPSLPDTLRPAVTEVLAVSVGQRVEHFGLPEDTEGGSSDIAKILGFLSSGPLHTSGRGVVELDVVRAAHSMTEIESNIRHLHERLSTITPGTRHHIILLDNLADWYETKSYRTHRDDVLDIEEAIEYRRRALASTSPTDLSRFHRLTSLGNAMSQQTGCTTLKTIKYFKYF